MKDDINLFSDKDLESLRPSAEALRDHWQSILDKIDRRINSLRQRSLPSPIGESNSHASLRKVYSVMLRANSYLSNQEIRKQLEDETGIKLSPNGIRVYLREGEGEYFQRQGESRYTVWRAIEKKNLQSQ